LAVFEIPAWTLAQNLWLATIGVATGLATFIGGACALRFRSHQHLVLGFSAGAVIAVALFDLLPEAIELAGGRAAPASAILGAAFFGYMLIDRASLISTSGEGGRRGHLGAGSLTLHSFFDGLAIGMAFQASPSVGVVVAAAILAHDFADGMNTVNISLLGGSGAHAARIWLAADALAPIAGLGAARLIAVSPAVLAATMAGLAGVFLYIGAAELLPESHHRHPRLWTSAATMLGAATIYLVVAASRL
jgi:ZIP family zinc transporter